MKIKPAHYAQIKTIIQNANVARDVVNAHREFIINEGKAKDVEKRLRWDIAYSANLSQWFCDNVYSYADNSHIDTALRSIMQELYS